LALSCVVDLAEMKGFKKSVKGPRVLGGQTVGRNGGQGGHPILAAYVAGANGERFVHSRSAGKFHDRLRVGGEIPARKDLGILDFGATALDFCLDDRLSLVPARLR
jgi:hypothetical protein